MATRTMDDVDRYHPLLVSLAYRMTGRASEAEDLAQESYVRFLAEAAGDGGTPKDALTGILARLCLDYLSSEAVREAHYEGPWLPEPVLTENDALPPLETEPARASISLPFLALLDTLAPAERAAYLLRDVFGHGDGEVADMLDMAASDYRRAHDRAAERIAADRPRFEYAPTAQQHLIERLVLACHQDETDDLRELLGEGVTAWTDGGGQVAAATRPVEGPDAVARYLAGYMRRSVGAANMTYAEVNSAPGLLWMRDESLAGVIAFDTADRAVRGVRLMLNPDKLAFIERQLRETR
jgi:DNA-directed RNA polymerase specialized sigma24 family protein